MQKAIMKEEESIVYSPELLIRIGDSMPQLISRGSNIMGMSGLSGPVRNSVPSQRHPKMSRNDQGLQSVSGARKTPELAVAFPHEPTDSSGYIQAPVRQSKGPPEDEVFQRHAGFAKFLKTHLSPRHKRVTAGGRVVPAGPKSPPPTFHLEFIESVVQANERAEVSHASLNGIVASSSSNALQNVVQGENRPSKEGVSSASKKMLDPRKIDGAANFRIRNIFEQKLPGHIVTEVISEKSAIVQARQGTTKMFAELGNDGTPALQTMDRVSGAMVSRSSGLPTPPTSTTQSHPRFQLPTPLLTPPPTAALYNDSYRQHVASPRDELPMATSSLERLLGKHAATYLTTLYSPTHYQSMDGTLSTSVVQPTMQSIVNPDSTTVASSQFNARSYRVLAEIATDRSVLDPAVEDFFAQAHSGPDAKSLTDQLVCMLMTRTDDVSDQHERLEEERRSKEEHFALNQGSDANRELAEFRAWAIPILDSLRKHKGHLRTQFMRVYNALFPGGAEKHIAAGLIEADESDRYQRSAVKPCGTKKTLCPTAPAFVPANTTAVAQQSRNNSPTLKKISATYTISGNPARRASNGASSATGTQMFEAIDPRASFEGYFLDPEYNGIKRLQWIASAETTQIKSRSDLQTSEKNAEMSAVACAHAKILKNFVPGLKLVKTFSWTRDVDEDEHTFRKRLDIQCRYIGEDPDDEDVVNAHRELNAILEKIDKLKPEEFIWDMGKQERPWVYRKRVQYQVKRLRDSEEARIGDLSKVEFATVASPGTLERKSPMKLTNSTANSVKLASGHTNALKASSSVASPKFNAAGTMSNVGSTARESLPHLSFPGPDASHKAVQTAPRSGNAMRSLATIHESEQEHSATAPSPRKRQRDVRSIWPIPESSAVSSSARAAQIHLLQVMGWMS